MNNYSKPELEKLLSDSIVTFLYRKKDGAERELTCTCDWDYLNKEGKAPYKFQTPRYQASYDVSKTENIIVWDCEKLAWRTVKASGVQEIISRKRTRR